MANKNMFLWWGSGSAPCWKAMLVLAEKGLWKGCPNKIIEFSKQEQKGDEVKKLNPRGEVPTFRDGDIIVNESAAICMYLEDKYSNDTNKLLPSGVEERAQLYQRMFESFNAHNIILEKLAYYLAETKKEDMNTEYVKEHTEKSKEELGRWNMILGDKDYLCGKNFTMADVLFYPSLAFIVRSGATLSSYTALKNYYDRVTSRPSVQATWPPHWKGTAGFGILGDL